MNLHAMQVLEFDKIKEEIKQYAITLKGKELVDNLKPAVDLVKIEGWILETTEARNILDRNSSVPIGTLDGIQAIIDKLGKGVVLTPQEFTAISKMLESVRRLKNFMIKMVSVSPNVASYALSMFEIPKVQDEIDKCINNGRVDDRASAKLNSIRKKINITDERIKQKLAGILNSPVYADSIRENVISVRNGRYVVPVKRANKKNLEGNILDMSSSGSTVFIEPAGIARLQSELDILRIEEESEVYRILSTLTVLVEGYTREILINIEGIIHYDFIFAKAKYSKSTDSLPVNLNTSGRIVIRNGRHPLIGKSAEPLNFYIGDEYRALIITGPNTGGKTVALKTVGLMVLMVQSGLHVPVDMDSEISIFNDILADIGDGQSIQQSLSTFSSHVKNISTIIKCSGRNTLVIMDELGAGTDPGEGMGFAVAVLEEVYKKGSTILASTHFSEIKEFANNTEGFQNGCMEFDINTLKPLYRLSIGKTGDSNAFLIALRLGVDKNIIERAHEITYKERKEYVLNEQNQIDSIVDEKAVEIHRENINRLGSIQKTRNTIENKKKASTQSFKIGDCVFISTMKRRGIVCEPENSKGEVTVMVMKKKLKINKKRLSIYIDREELYPEGNYDMDIVFESKDKRRKKKIMSKRHIEGMVIE